MTSAFAQSRHAAIVVAVDSPQWTIVEVNDAYLRATHRTRDALMGRPLFEAFPESAETSEGQSSLQIRQSLERAKAGEGVALPVLRYDLPVPHASRRFEEHWWQLTSAPLRSDAGDVIAVLHEVENVTERERARRESATLAATGEEQNETLQSQALELEMTNQQLQENAVELEAQTEQLQATAAQLEERTEEAEAARRAAEAAKQQLQTVFAQAPAAVAVTEGPEHRFVLANKGYEMLAGRTIELGRTFRDMLPEIVEQGFEDLLSRVYRTGEPYVANESPAMVSRDGGPPVQGWYDFVYQPLVDADGRVTGVLQQGIDVTARVRGAVALRQSEV